MDSAMQKLVLSLVGWLLVAASPVSAKAPEQAADDVVGSFEKKLLVNGEDGARYWRPSEESLKRAPRYPIGLGQDQESGCVAMGFTIRPDGVPTDFHVLQFAANKPSREVQWKFAASAIQALSRWRYEPGPENAQRLPGYAVNVSSFRLSRGIADGPADWSPACRIDDLGAFLRARAANAGN